MRFDDMEENAEYRAFVDKFKTRKTTDDCETPGNVYDAVAGWVAEEYAVKPPFVRPFWPGGDYERAEYPEGCVVVDNPPFSILAKIEANYLARGVRFFLFAPTLTLFNSDRRVCFIPCGSKITYVNGANVNTSFVTNLDTAQVRSAPELYRRIKAANDANEKAATKQLPKYSYPDHVLTAAAAYQYSHYGVDFRMEREDCVFIRGMDAQAQRGKSCFGGAFLLSDRAAAERAAAERAAAGVEPMTWTLSERERAIVDGLGGDKPCR